MKQIFMAAMIAAVFNTGAYAACSNAEVQQKAADFASASQAMAQKDPQRFAAIMQGLQAELNGLPGSSDNDALCRFYDKAINQMK